MAIGLTSTTILIKKKRAFPFQNHCSNIECNNPLALRLHYFFPDFWSNQVSLPRCNLQNQVQKLIGKIRWNCVRHCWRYLGKTCTFRPGDGRRFDVLNDYCRADRHHYSHALKKIRICPGYHRRAFRNLFTGYCWIRRILMACNYFSTLDYLRPANRYLKKQ